MMKPKSLYSLYFKKYCVIKTLKKSLNRLPIEYYVKD